LEKYFGRVQFMTMANASKRPDDSDIAHRLRTLRRVVSGENQTDFALRVGVEVKRWNNFERGYPLSKEVAFLLVRKVPGLTLDWLWLGNEGGLPVKLQRELEAAGKGSTSAKGARS
jgi:hypothetical protein